MRSHEILFIIAVFGIAGILAAWSISDAWDVAGTETSVEFTPRGTTGIPRDVNTNRMKGLIEEGYLSDHEAVFYHRADEAPSEPTPLSPSR